MITNRVTGLKPARAPLHRCHWPGCNVEVPPSLWGCKPHWKLLPQRIRSAILKAYRPGQEVTKDPSRDYIAAAAEARAWIKTWEPIVFSADCDEEGNCPKCGEDFGECPHLGPTQDGVEYLEAPEGLLGRRKVANCNG